MADFYEIRTMWVECASEFFRAINNSKVVDYHLCKKSLNGMFRLILVLKI